MHSYNEYSWQTPKNNLTHDVKKINSNCFLKVFTEMYYAKIFLWELFIIKLKKYY